MAIDPEKAFTPINIAVLTVSDTRTPETDTSGDILVKRLENAGHVLAARLIIKDEAALLADQFAVKDGWDGILAEQLDSRNRPCIFVELMPRLMEQ